jgi:hypothetical protein
MLEGVCTISASVPAGMLRAAPLLLAALLCGGARAEEAVVSSLSSAGLRESPEDGLLARFLGQPAPAGSERGAEPSSALRLHVWRKPMERAARPVSGPDDRRAFARIDGERFSPGLLRGGETAATARALSWLQERGYPYATLSVERAPDGALLLRVDEGALRSFDLRGVPAPLRTEALRTSGLRPGALFSGPALRQAVARLTARYPFLSLDTTRAVSQEDPPGAPPSFWERGRIDLGDLFFDWEYDRGGGSGAERPPADRGPGSAGNAVEVTAPGEVLVWLRTRPVTLAVQWDALLRHTPATGFAPGLAGTLHLWDGEDRAHLALDGAFAVNTERPSRAPAADAGSLERLSAFERLDFLAGARLAVPAWRLAEVGAQVYALTDTGDAWRMGDLDSSLHSAISAQPDRDYFRRAGLTLLATAHLFEQLTLGAELRRDRFDPLPNGPVWSVLGRGAALQPAAPVTPGQIGALLLRAEWSSEEIPLLQIGALRRHPEVSLSGAASAARFTGLFALELGNGALGSDPGIDYLRLLGDARVRFFPAEGLSLHTRLRGALVTGAGVPLQKEEALGGWTALRGYPFKERRGDATVLGTAELRWRWLGAFVDLGAAHGADGWSGPLPGGGAQLFLDKLGRLEVAWRLDGHGGLAPTARALFGPEL